MDNNNNIKIKHLVFSGGGPAGLITYGAVKHLAKTGVWALHNIQSMYGCSIGAYIGICISLGYEWEWLDDYIIKRPWNKVISITAQTFLDAYDQKGLLGEKFLLESLKPLLEAKDLNVRLANVVKYVSRAGKKNSDPVQDLEKAAWYLKREIDARKGA